MRSELGRIAKQEFENARQTSDRELQRTILLRSIAASLLDIRDAIVAYSFFFLVLLVLIAIGVIT